jgi:hypothetical protein
VIVTLASLLFMQLAVAGYACPVTVSMAAGIGTDKESAMPCAESMGAGMNVDTDQPQLCHAHCQADQQSLDKHELPALVSIDALPVSFSVPVVIVAFARYALEQRLLQRVTDPPLAIRNCCFRL